MPQAAPFVSAFLYGASATASAGLLFAAALGAVAQTVIINMVLGAVSKALGPKSASGRSAAINVTVRSTTSSRSVVLGTARVGGTIVFYGCSGTSNKYLHYVIAYAGHQVSAVKDIWLDTVKVLHANINAGTGAVTQSPFTGKLNIWRYTGTHSQAADATMIAAFPGKWTSAFQLKGCAYAHVRMERDDTAFPQGAPNSATAYIEGAKLYDPRLDTTNGGSGSHRYTDATTWAYSANPVLALRWILTGGSVTTSTATPLVKYGLKDSNARIDDAYIIAAANICEEDLTGSYATPTGDQTRYAIGKEFSCGESLRTWIEDTLATMAGMCFYVNGKWRVYAGAYDTPTHTVTDADVYGDIQITDTSSHDERYNAVGAVFRDSANEFIEQTIQFRTDSTYETQDGGERIPKELDLSGVTNDSRAQRLCEIEKRKSRLMRTIKITGALNLLKIAPGETFTFSNTKYGWTNRVFRCLERQFAFSEEAGRVEITARAESTDVWDDMETADYNDPNTHTPIVVTELPEPPTSIGTVGLTNAIIVSWVKSATANVSYTLQESTSSTMSSPTTVYAGSDNQVTLYKAATTTYYYRVYATKLGQVSTNEPTSGGVSGAALALSAALNASVSPSTATSSSTSASQTTNTVTVTPTGGTGPYTYLWTDLSGMTSITTNSTTAATTDYTATSLASPETRSGVSRCTVTDNVAATKTVDVSVNIERTAGYTVVASPDDLATPYYASGDVTTISTTATPSGGTAPYTYLWSWWGGGAGVTIDSPTAATTTCTAAGLTWGTDNVGGVLICTVTDNVSAVAESNFVTVSIYWDI